jgi:hypothetical protein
VARFNLEGRTVSADHPMSVYVDGVTQEPDAFRFEAPGTLHFGSRLVDQTVVVDYHVLEATGGNQSFKMLSSPMEVDLPAIVGLDVADSPTSTFNGDKRGELFAGVAVLADDKSVFVVSSASYDSASDTTSVTFNPPPATSVSGVSFKACGKITGDYLVQEILPVDIVPKGTSTLTVRGDADYKAGTVVFLDSDPFLAISVNRDAQTGSTVVTTLFHPSAGRSVRSSARRRRSRPPSRPTSDIRSPSSASGPGRGSCARTWTTPWPRAAT